MNRLSTVLLALLLVSACGDPEKSAQKSVDEIKAQWDKAHETLDPKARVKAYEASVERLEGIAKKYEKTRVGGALAGGGSVSGLSLASVKTEHDRLAERADCYAKPTAECLLPFASSGFRHQTDGAGSADNALGQATGLVCDKGFAKAEAALDDVKINPPVYAADLVQVALAAAQCDKPDEATKAIDAYLAAEPAVGPNRVNQFLGILNTDRLSASWPHVLAALEKEIPAAGLDQGRAAGADLAMSVKYAAIGDAKTALAKFNHVTEQGYNPDVNTRLDLAAELIAGGDPADGLNVAGQEGPQAENMRMTAITRATMMLGARMGVIRPGGSASANVPYDGDMTEFFAPIKGTAKDADAKVAGQIEAELDKFVASLQPKGQYLGQSGADGVYGMLALINQKLGNAGKAAELAKKAEDTRAALMPPGSYSPASQSYAAEFELLVALAQNKIDEAIAIYPRVVPVGNDEAKPIFIALAKKGEAEKALTFASQINRAGGNTYELLINALGASGHADKAEKVLNAFPGSDTTRSAMAWALVEKAAASGDMRSAEKVADKYKLLNTPAYNLRMTELKAEAAIAKRDRGKAEAAIREMFKQGDEIDKMAAQERENGYFAQNAAKVAFKAGYTDLGIELYRAASSKDQRPFFAAFTEDSKTSDFPKVLMVATDNLRGEKLGYVIDAAIRRLQGKT